MNQETHSLRVLLNCLLFASILFLPWWFTMGLMIFFLFSFETYEVLFFGLFGDMIYSNPVPLYGNVPFLFTLLALMLFFLVGIIKRRLIFYTY